MALGCALVLAEVQWDCVGTVKVPKAACGPEEPCPRSPPWIVGCCSKIRVDTIGGARSVTWAAGPPGAERLPLLEYFEM